MAREETTWTERQPNGLKRASQMVILAGGICALVAALYTGLNVYAAWNQLPARVAAVEKANSDLKASIDAQNTALVRIEEKVSLILKLDERNRNKP